MFTGLIEEVGSIEALRLDPAGMRLKVRCPAMAGALRIGDSVAVNGVCLTLVACGREDFEAEAVGDTLEKTSLRRARRGDRVNLERALSASGRLDGHMVMGHVTGTARIRSWGPAAGSPGAGRGIEAWALVLDLAPSWADRAAAEGSIAIDGISLTIAGIEGAGAEAGSAARRGSLCARVSVIPHTRLATNLADRKAGDEVNVELDIVASYVRASVAAMLGGGSALAGPSAGAARIDIDSLKSWGYK